MLVFAFVTAGFGSMASAQTSSDPRIEVYIVQGHISCGFGTWFVSLVDRCSFPLENPPPILNLSIGPGSVTAVRYELVWTPSASFGARTLLLVFTPFAVKRNFNDTVSVTSDDRVSFTPVDERGTQLATGAQGVSPVAIEAVPIPPATKVFGWKSLTFYVRPAASTFDELLADPAHLGGASGLIVDQDFRACATLAFNGAPLPPTPAC